MHRFVGANLLRTGNDTPEKDAMGKQLIYTLVSKVSPQRRRGQAQPGEVESAKDGRWQWGAAAILAAGMGAVLATVGVPGAWILGFAIVFCCAAVLANRAFTPTGAAVNGAQVVIGVVAAAPLADVDPGQIGHYVVLVLVITFVTLAMSVAFGILMHVLKPGNIDTVTGVLCMLAGGASAMALLARQVGADQRYVVVVQ